jgi:PiT family inorganic phosphate transporter
MTLTAAILLVSVLFVAYTNGANDNFKGVATLFGSGTANYTRALAWATVCTLAGSMLALVLAEELVKNFSGKGLVPDAVTADPRFLSAVSLGAALTVLIATYIGMPVSTTHALTGGLVGAGLLASNGDVTFSKLGKAFVLPLLLAPVVSILLAVVMYPILRFVGRRMSRSPRPLVLDIGHYLSAGAVSFARGLNDAPKIVALMIAGSMINRYVGLALVAVVMGFGGILSAKKVAQTMSQKITKMSPGQGFTANLITAFLVAGASRYGWPVSTTHVSVGSLFGIGIVNRTAQMRTILNILLAWVTTLPTGAALAALAYAVLGIL